MRKLRLRFRSLLHRSLVENDLKDELRGYLEQEIERQIAAGSSPDEARMFAKSSLNGAERLKEECRDARGVRWLEETIQDLRFAGRTLRHAPVFSLTVICRPGVLHWCKHRHLLCGGYSPLSPLAVS